MLGVTQNEIRRLQAHGSLAGQKVGGRLLFETAELNRLQHSERSAGRPWSPSTAWAALELLSGLGTSLIDQPRTSRLKRRLKELSPDQVHWLARGRARVKRFHASPRALSRVVSLALPTGDSALADDDVAIRFGLAEARNDSHFDGYLTASLDRAVSSARLREDPSGNVTLRELPTWNLAERVLGSDALIALDLMDSDDVRERSAGRQRIEDLINDL